MTATIPSGGGAPSNHRRPRVAGQRRPVAPDPTQIAPTQATAPMAYPPSVPRIFPPSLAWAILLGLPGAWWASRKARVYGYPTRRYWKAAIWSTVITLFVTCVLPVLLLVVIAASLNGSSGTSVGSAPQPVTAVSHPAVSSTAPAVVSLPSLDGLSRPGPTATPDEISSDLIKIEAHATCLGGTTGIGFLDYYWESHGDPAALGIYIPSAVSPGQAAPVQPAFTYATIASVVQNETSKPNYCGKPIDTSNYRVIGSTTISSTRTMIETILVDSSTGQTVQGYTGVYDLVNGYWVVNQVH